ncbi:TATA-binding protein-associated factor 172 isoform X2 [Hyalella azteca]|uniref:TATA-binding protein-associated factor 172 isoform X2 n=1 Tax=Hyalella azteca TaxID=294128 RepID=A0A8B7P8R7_HYAAZ|nr:TATA-binding protein-associated factor 172 isoform X2 [Hyalella azteca]
MSSRLDRLFILLESSSSAVTRKAAASQLGDVVKGYTSESKELRALLERLVLLVLSKSWDTRVAAGTALGCVLTNIPPWEPQPSIKENATYTGDWSIICSDGVTLVQTVLECGHQLMAHDEIPQNEIAHNTDAATRLQKERSVLNKKLGLDVAASLGLDTSNIITNDDLLGVPSCTALDAEVKEMPRDLLSHVPALNPCSLRGKRGAPQPLDDCKRVKLQAENTPDVTEEDEWPLCWLSKRLLEEMFNGCWETRHGAATALRELLAKHGGCGGKMNKLSAVQMESRHQWWVWGVCYRLVCVLALDTFGDYLGDQVVAPVRETIAQALGVACIQLQQQYVVYVVKLLKVLLLWQSNWTVRHGGLLGLKYLLAARVDMRSSLLTHAYSHIYAGLKDAADEVVGVAAECLKVCCDPRNSSSTAAPAFRRYSSFTLDKCGDQASGKLSRNEKVIAAAKRLTDRGTLVDAGANVRSSLVDWLSEPQLQELLTTVWQSLLHVDDLSAFTPALLLLLANLMQHKASLHALEEGRLRELVPRLFPLMYHASSSVRRSALTTLLALTLPQPTTHAPLVSHKPKHQNLPSEVKLNQFDEISSTITEIPSSSQPCSSASSSTSPSLEVKCESSRSSVNFEVQSCELSGTAKPSTASITSCEASPALGREPQVIVTSTGEELTPSEHLFQQWCEPILSPLLRHLFQRSLLETCLKNLKLLEQVWQQVLRRCSLNAVLVSACPMVSLWLSLAATPGAVPLDSSLLLLSVSTASTEGKLCREAGTGDVTSIPSLPCFVGGSQHCKKEQLAQCKTYSTRLLGELSVYVSEPMRGVAYSSIDEPLKCYTRLLLSQLASRSAYLRTNAASVARDWALAHTRHHHERRLQSSGSSKESSSEPPQSAVNSTTSFSFCDSHQFIAFATPQKISSVLPEPAANTGASAGLSKNVSESMASPNGLDSVKTNSASSASELDSNQAIGIVSGSNDCGNEADGSATCRTSVMQELYDALLNCLSEPLYYDEIAVAFTKLQHDVRDFLSLMRHYGLRVADELILAPVYTLDQMGEAVLGQWVQEELQSSKLRVKVRDMLETRRRTVQSSLASTTSIQEAHVLAVRGKAAGALVCMGLVPAKLNPVVKPLMDVIKYQDNEELQSNAGRDLSVLLEFCALRERTNAKVVKNLTSYYCVDTAHTPNIAHLAEVRPHDDKFDGVFFIKSQHEESVDVNATPAVAEAAPQQQGDGGNSVVKRRRGRPPANPKPEITTPAATEPAAHANSTKRSEAELAKIFIQRRGCGLAIQHLVRGFGSSLPERLPVLWGTIYKPLVTPDSLHKPIVSQAGKSDVSSLPIDARKKKTVPASSPLAHCPFSVANILSRNDVPNNSTLNPGQATTSDGPNRHERNCSSPNGDVKAQDIINWLQLLEVVIPDLVPELLDQICDHLGSLELLLYHRYCAVRHMAARALSCLVSVRPLSVMVYLLEHLLPALSDVHSIVRRQGAVECFYMIVKKLDLDILPYVVLLLVPLLGSSSDSDKSVRAAGSEVFASLVRLLPLDGCVPDPPDMPEHLCQQRLHHREFLKQLMDGKRAHHYPLPVRVSCELRQYQQAGVNWLAFLRDFGVHGILCDDMGLGKTLQTICILAATHHEHRTRQQACGESYKPLLQSLVVCPPTLSGHWVYEVKKFVTDDLIKPLNFTGVPAERIKLREKFSSHNLVVASYDIVRNDIEFFSTFQWLYIVLDEGHIIKNTKTKAYQAIKRLTGRHRLILSGTPIQNNVLELWSLFDFLMPGYLGTERQFTLKYVRPILASRDVKASLSEQEAGVVAMEALHRQALPFMMRRLKEDVLQELPPKIMQDYYCELSSVQRVLYEDFVNSQGEDFQDDHVPKTHVFQALQYLRLVCNHPALVLRPQHPRYAALLKRVGVTPSQLHNISFAAKLPALKELLLECGIGTSNSSCNSTPAVDVSCVIAPHRALIFCQLRNMLDIIENDLFKIHMPSVTYVRLDGSVPAGLRHGLVQRFNEDPSIDVMLLTTQVGGLGLNLTAADTVIFVEHDWNPMTDLQAMDRAHRIGQKRVVTVYRLITRNTLEEKIMGLQKFKMMTANTIISHDNANITSMGTEQILDLFSLENSNKKKECASGDQAIEMLGTGAPKAVIESLPELWEHSQYHDEYDLDKFLAGIVR